MMMRNRGITLKSTAMPTRKKNNPDALDANPSIDNAGLNISPSLSGSNIADAAYSPTAGSDLNTSTGSSSGSANNMNMPIVTDIYNRASRWISENPTIAISAAVGIVAAVVGIVVASQSSRRSGPFQSKYPTGPINGNVYGSESGTYTSSTQAESSDRGGNYTSSGSDNYTGL
jgi:hypothetical protein